MRASRLLLFVVVFAVLVNATVAQQPESKPSLEWNRPKTSRTVF